MTNENLENLGNIELIELLNLLEGINDSLGDESHE